MIRSLSLLLMLALLPLMGCKTSPERAAHTAADASIEVVNAALTVWAADFARRAEPHVIPGTRSDLDLSNAPGLSAELAEVDRALTAWQGGTRAGIHAALGVKAVAPLTPENLERLRLEFSASAAELLKLLKK